MSVGRISIIKQSNRINTGTVIFLHGSGDTGEGIKNTIQFLQKDNAFPHLKILFPTAPFRPYTVLNGQHSNIWFDRLNISPEVPECLESVENTAKELMTLIDSEVASGIPKSRIVIGGFSMGGSMALYLGYKYVKELAGVFALSSFMNNNSSLYQELKNISNSELPPLFYCHGSHDDLIPLEDGKSTFNTLQNLGILGQFHIIKNASHEIKSYELDMLYQWITEIVPVAE